MSATGRGAPAQSATADRQIAISRVISAPRELVFEAFTEVRHLSRWWGPEGFTTTTRAFEFRVGGEWDFVMHGPDGTDYQEWISWTEIAAPERSAPLDGFIAPEERMDDPDVQRWMAQWMELQQWIFPQRFFRENLKLGEGGEEGRDNDIARETFERTGASVMGKRMFDLGEQAWPQEAPFHTPVFVVTHEKRDPWERPGGTTFC